MDKSLTNRRFKLNMGSWGPFFAFLVLFVFSALSNENFLTWLNISNVLRQLSINGVIAVGMFLVILTGGIDLSVGSVVAVAGAFAALTSGMSVIFPIIIPLLVGSVYGCLNGILVTKAKMAPFIATLATMMAGRGLAYVLIGTKSVGVERTTDTFMNISRGDILYLPVPTIILLCVIVLFAFVLKYTSFGRNIYSVGGNAEAANMMGLKCDRIKIATYILCGLLAALGGILTTARVGTALPVAGQGMELEAISTVVLGGTYLTGGRGKMSGTFWAILTMGLFTNMFNMQENVTTWTQNIITGLLLLAIVIFQSETVKHGINTLTGKFKKTT